MSRLDTSQLEQDRNQGHRELEENYFRAEKMVGYAPKRAEYLDEGYAPIHGGMGGHSQNVGNVERVLSIAAGAGLAAVGLARRRWDGLLFGALGAALAWRGYTGRCQCYAALGINTAKHNPATAVSAQQGVKIEKKIRINRSAEEVYRFWRDLKNLPQVMAHLKKVEPQDSQRSHWVANGPFGKEIEWDAEIINEREPELIAWRSLPGGDIDTAGSVHFNRTPAGGTELTLSMKYNPPAGKIGAQLVDWLGDGLEQKLSDDLNRFKTKMESGVVEQAPLGQM
jgi:uncharacterized membrane protein